MRQSTIGAGRAGAALAALALSACTTTVVEAPAAPPPAPAPAPAQTAMVPTVPMGQQWLYGSAEGAIAVRQTYGALTAYALAKAKARPADSVIIDEATGKPFACGNKPLAAVFDADETLIWNIGPMRWFALTGKEFDAKTWDQWEKTGTGKAVAMPGAVEAMQALRAAGITPIANTNRSSANAAGSAELREGAPAEPDGLRRGRLREAHFDQLSGQPAQEAVQAGENTFII